MLFSDFYKIMVNKVTFTELRGAIAPSLDSACNYVWRQWRSQPKNFGGAKMLDFTVGH